MRITHVRVKLAPRGDEKLLAFASITFDGCFVVRDIKVIQGAGGQFVAMPSRKVADRCTHCGAKNQLQAVFCNRCGGRLAQGRAAHDARGGAKFHADIAHPINARCRQEIQEAILKEYHGELARSRQPGYVPAELDELEEEAAGPGAREAPASRKTTVGEPPQPNSDGTGPGPAKKDPRAGPPDKPDPGAFGILG
jgi:stage V sporulation protein G